MKKQKKKELILNIALELFALKGYRNTKMVDIAESANIGKSTIYDYFSSKENILCEIIDTKIFQFYKQLQNNFLEINDASSKLNKFIEYECEDINSSGQAFCTIVNTLINPEHFASKKIHDSFHEAHKIRFNIIKEIIEQGITDGEFKDTNPNMASSAVLGALNFFLIHQHKLQHPMYQESEIIGSTDIVEISNIILYGLKK